MEEDGSLSLINKNEINNTPNIIDANIEINIKYQNINFHFKSKIF